MGKIKFLTSDKVLEVITCSKITGGEIDVLITG
jgi:hypothetical protein